MIAILLAPYAEAVQDPASHDLAAGLAYVRVVADLRIEFPQLARLPVRRPNVVLGSGTGFLVTPSGLILTSLHVVEEQESQSSELADGEATEVSFENRRIEVVLGGEETPFKADLVASDDDSDLAALQLTAAALPYLRLGDSAALDPGAPVTVLGFPFGQQIEVAKRLNPGVAPGPTVTTGTFSAPRVDDAGATRFLQTDASMNPGNSGGPMLDEDGYVVGLVRMKLAAEAASEGAGFAVAGDVVKDFLDAHGLSGELPERLRPGRLEAMDWKRLAIALPDILRDDSPSRLRIAAGDEGGGISFRAFRLATSMSLTKLEERLLDGELPEFVAGRATLTRRRDGMRASPKRLLGTAYASDAGGERIRIEYAILDLGDERIAARYAGPPDAVAYNLAVLRGSLLHMEARAMLGGAAHELQTPLDFVPAPLGLSGAVPVPAGWSVEPDTRSACAALPQAAAGLAASPAADYTVVLRALRWDAKGAELQRGLQSCASQAFSRFGTAILSRSVLVARDGTLLLLELEAPRARMAAAQPVFEAWVRTVEAGH